MNASATKTDLSPNGLLPLDMDCLIFEIADAPPLPEVQNMSQAPKAFSHEPVDAPRWIAWAAVAATLAALAFVLGGCSSAREDQAVEIIHEAKILLDQPYPEGKRWQARRVEFLQDAAVWLHGVAPTTSEAR